MNKDLEDRIIKLEECCNWYKSRISSLEDQLNDRISHIERQMHSPLSAKAEEKEDESAQTDFQMFKGEIQKRKEHLVKQLDGVLKSVNLSDAKHPPEWGTTKLDEIYRNSYKNLNFELLDQLYELYNTIKHRASKYHIDGNSSIAKKCMIEAEIIFEELKKYEQLLEETWIKLNTLRVPDAPAHSPLFSHPGGYKSYLKGGKRKTRKHK